MLVILFIDEPLFNENKKRERKHTARTKTEMFEQMFCIRSPIHCWQPFNLSHQIKCQNQIVFVPFRSLCLSFPFFIECTEIDKHVRQFARYKIERVKKSVIFSDAIGLLFSETKKGTTKNQ